MLSTFFYVFYVKNLKEGILFYSQTKLLHTIVYKKESFLVQVNTSYLVFLK